MNFNCILKGCVFFVCKVGERIYPSLERFFVVKRKGERAGKLIKMEILKKNKH
jgi:hypothetical protein